MSRRIVLFAITLLFSLHIKCTLQQQCDPCAGSDSNSIFKVKPGTGCVEYVQCFSGQNMGDFRCSGDTIYDEEKQYCNWVSNVNCVDTGCPPTNEPTIWIPEEDCNNPCPVGFTGFKTLPNSDCKEYVQCEDGQIVDELQCFGDTIFNQEAEYCDWPNQYTCGRFPCPKRDTLSPSKQPTKQPSEKPTQLDVATVSRLTTSPVVTTTITIEVPEPTVVDILVVDGSEGSTIVADGSSDDCSNSCPLLNSTGLYTKPGTNCKIFVECENGQVISEMECTGELFFIEESGVCEDTAFNEDLSEWSCPEIPCESIPDPTIQPTQTPTTPKPTPMPVSLSTYQDFRTYLTDREDMLKGIVLKQSNGYPSTAYTYPDFITALDIATLQLPADKAFFNGEGTEGRLPKLSGMEYGLVNIAAFLSNAMEMGIRIDSCDEWNTDYEQAPHEKFPLSNSCGQYGRSYEDEICSADEPFQCAVDTTMEATAVDGNREQNIPPFTCRPPIIVGGKEVFPGYYDSVDKVVIESAYANTLGRTDIAGCCWWGRGVLFTRGTCALGKLDMYVGQGAVDRGIYVYPDINFCTNPEVICNHESSNVLRWLLGLLEWSDRIQTYIDPSTGWNYLDELKKFVDDGMVDTEFIQSAVNIVTRNCHDDLCPDQWPPGDEVFMENRVDHFRQINFEVFNLPMTYQPTVSPSPPPSTSPTLSPTITKRPTNMPTSRPTRKKKVIALPPNSAKHDRRCGQLTAMILALIIPYIMCHWT